MENPAVQGELFVSRGLTEDYIAKRYPQVGAREFYRDLFPVGSLERRGEYERGKYCAIAVRLDGKKPRRYSVTDDLEVLDELASSDDFCLMSPVSYAGKTQRQSMARWLYAVAIDLDDLITEIGRWGEPIGIHELFFEIGNDVVPMPTYMVSSGSTGLHLYYMLNRPIALYPNVIKQLSRLRHDLIFRLWNRYITERETPQYESVTQGFRLVGSITKAGDRVRAYKTGEKTSIEHLNQYVFEVENQVTELRYKSPHTLEEAKKLYPEWYEKRIIQKSSKGTWLAHRGLYEWWKTQIDKSSYGHRYFWIMALAIYAAKTGVGYDELVKDAMSFVPHLNGLNTNKPFTPADALKACETYHADLQTYPRRSIELITAIQIPTARRNYREQTQHLKIARFTRDMNQEVAGTDWRYHGGAPTKEAIVREWRAAHPTGRKIDCERDTGLSRPTVLKWW